MKLYEFDFGTSDETILSGVVGLVLNRIKDTGYKNTYSLQTVLSQLQDRGLDIDEEMFVKMIEKPPLSNIIDSVQDGDIVFKGMDGKQATDISSEQDEEEKQADTLEKMAKRATKKREI